MGDVLSQDEINELLKSQTVSASSEEKILNDFEIDTLGEVGNISMGSAATVLHNLLNRKVMITTPVVSITDQAKLAQKYTIPYVAIHVSYVEGLIGDNILIIKCQQ